MKIINVNARYPGSTHDAYIWNRSNISNTMQQLHINGYYSYWMLGIYAYKLIFMNFELKFKIIYLSVQ